MEKSEVEKSNKGLLENKLAPLCRSVVGSNVSSEIGSDRKIESPQKEYIAEEKIEKDDKENTVRIAKQIVEVPIYI